jgi:hypothetical protein
VSSGICSIRNIDEAPVIVVVGEQQSTEQRPRPLGLAVADDDELLHLVALALAPQTAIAGRVGGIYPLRHDALGLRLAGGLEEALAVADRGVAELDAARRALEQAFQPFLAVKQR